MKNRRPIILLLAAMILTSAPAAAVDTLYDQRFKRWTEEAQAGKARAQYKLGNAYLRGNEVEKDVDTAVDWFKKAAEQDYAKAQYKLGYLYYTGQGVRRNQRKAHNYLLSAAKKQYSPAQFYLGKQFAEGNGVRRDFTKALYWLKRAAADQYAGAKDEIAKVENLMADQKRQQRAAEEAAKRAAEAERKARLAALTVKQRQAEELKRRRAEDAKKARERRERLAREKAEAEARAKAAAAREESKKTASQAAAEPDAGQTFDIRSLLLTGKWINEGGIQSSHMPSELNRCEQKGDAIVCHSEELKRTSDIAEVTYTVESRFGRFTDEKFLGSYRTNILYVAADEDEVVGSPEDLPKRGLQPRTVIKCSFEGPKSLNCVNDSFERLRYTSN